MKKFLAGFIVVLTFGFWATNAPAQWKRIFLPVGPTPYNITSLASSGGYIYVGGTLSGTPLIYRSNDDGVNWKSITTPLFNNPVALAASGNNVYAVFNDGVKSSSNNGDGWTDISPPLPIGSYSDRSILVSGTDIFIGTVGGNGGAGMYASKNNGSTWDTIGSGYGDTIGLSRENYNIFALYYDGSKLFAGSDPGVNVNSDPLNRGGWSLLSNDLKSLNINAFLGIGSQLFVGTSNGLFGPNDSVNGFSLVGTADPVYSLAANGQDIFAGVGAMDGVFRTNGQKNWLSWKQGLSEGALQGGGFALTISGNNAYLGAVGGGLWQRAINDFDAVQQANINQPDLSQNYPNPFNTATTIHYSLAQEGRVSLSVYNMIGERVALLKDGLEPAGDNVATFVSGALPSGLYCYRLLTASGGTTSRIMQIER